MDNKRVCSLVVFICSPNLQVAGSILALDLIFVFPIFLSPELVSPIFLSPKLGVFLTVSYNLFSYFFVPYSLTNGSCTLFPPSYSRIHKVELFFSLQSWNTAWHILALIYALLGSQAHITCPLDHYSRTTFSAFVHLHVWVHVVCGREKVVHRVGS